MVTIAKETNGFRLWRGRSESLGLFCVAVAIFVVMMLGSFVECDAQIGHPVMRKSSDFVFTPEQAAARIDGRLKINLKVDEKGDVTDADILAGPIWPCGKDPKKELGEFRSAAVKNARTFKFEPPWDEGKPVKSSIVLTVTVGDAYKRALAREDAKAHPEKCLKVCLINGGVVNGTAISLPKPLYPLMPAYGVVTVDVIIDETGKVIAAGTISGAAELHSRSREAACDAKFSPTTILGRPVRVTGLITYNYGSTFRLPK